MKSSLTRPRSFVIALFASALLVACSSNTTSSAPPPASLTCALVPDSPDCGGAFESECSGPGTPTAYQLGMVSSQCDAGTAVDGGKTRYCCTGCTTTTDGGSRCADHDVTVDWTSSVCTPGETPPASPAIPLAANAQGQIPYCFPQTSTKSATYCQTDPDVGCTSGHGVFCNGNNEPPQGAGFTCSDGVAPSNRGYEFCCTGGGDGCSKGAASTSVAKATTYTCAGSTRPEQVNTGIACGAGILISDMPNSFNVSTRFACVSFTSKSCTATPVPRCVDEGLFGFTCTGKATPADTVPALHCSLPFSSDAGAQSYCCKTN